MNTATYIGTTSGEDNFIFWFDLSGETYGVSESSSEIVILDCDGCPINTDDALVARLQDALVVTDEMRAAAK